MGKGIRKFIILALIFIAVIGIFIWTTREVESKKTYTVMSEASMPVVRLHYQNLLINELRGYRDEMEGSSVRESLYPLSEDCRLPVQITTSSAEVTAIGYEVRSLDGARLIEENRTEALTKQADGVYLAEVKLVDLLERDEEYQVTFTVFLADGTQSYHYARVSFDGAETVQGAVEFALDFSEKTFLEEPDEILIAQLESDTTADNSSFSYTDIYSSYSHVLWDKLRPEKVGETSVTIHEIDRLVTSLVLEYEVRAQDEGGEEERYQVREFYCIRYVNGKYYLMTYERLAEEVFDDGEEVILEDGSLELGIIGKEELSMSIIRQGDYTVFVKNGILWCYDAKADVLGTLFAFDQKAATGYDGEDAGIRVVRVGDQGDVEFIVYGYMSSGAHEGKCGIAYYRYMAAEDALEELFFVNSERSGDLVREDVGALSYLSESGLFYLLYGDTIYAIDLEGGEYAELISGVDRDSLAVDAEEGILAWQEGEDIGGEKIVIYSLNKGESRILTAPEGERYRLIGFIGEDLLYGGIREIDIAKYSVYSTKLPLYALEIISSEGEKVSHYEKSGMYLTDVEILSDRVQFDRRSLIDGVWEDMGEDTLFSRVESEEEEESILKSSVSERKKRVYRLDLGLTEKTIIRYHCPKLLVKESRYLVLGEEGEKQSERYYAYSYGKLQGIYDSAAAAIAVVDDALGVVLNDAQQTVWNRGNRGSSARISLAMWEPVTDPDLQDYLKLYLQKLGSVADFREDLAAGMNIFELLKKYSDAALLDLEGCSLDQILFYLDAKQPVLGFAEDNRAVLLVGYEELYGQVTFLVHSMETAQAEEYSYEEVKGWFETSGNRFISTLPQ